MVGFGNGWYKRTFREIAPLYILEGVLDFCTACGAGARQRKALSFPPSPLSLHRGDAEMGCKGDTDFGAWSASSMGGTSALLNYSGPRRQPTADLRGPSVFAIATP